VKMHGYFFGMIQEVYSPIDPKNVSKYQYEYQVMLTGNEYATIPMRCIRKDSFGSGDDFDDMIMQAGDKVMVQFPRGDRSVGIIHHSTRNYVAPQNTALGRHWRTRFNQIVKYIDANGNYSVTSDQGPNLQVNTSTIVLDDASGDKITIDKSAKSITIDCGTWNVNVSGNATIKVTGDVSLTAANVDVTAQENAIVKAASIQLNGSSGQVLTTVTDPVIDTIFGEPTMGVPTVVAG
jgi:hypothetical protein